MVICFLACLFFSSLDLLPYHPTFQHLKRGSELYWIYLPDSFGSYAQNYFSNSMTLFISTSKSSQCPGHFIWTQIFGIVDMITERLITATIETTEETIPRLWYDRLPANYYRVRTYWIIFRKICWVAFPGHHFNYKVRGWCDYPQQNRIWPHSANNLFKDVYIQHWFHLCCRVCRAALFTYVSLYSTAKTPCGRLLGSKEILMRKIWRALNDEIGYLATPKLYGEWVEHVRGRSEKNDSSNVHDFVPATASGAGYVEAMLMELSRSKCGKIFKYHPCLEKRAIK